MRIDVEVPTTLSVLDFYAQIGAFVSFELIHIVIILLGGIALFLFGMQLMGDGLKKVAGGKLEVILYRLSNTPLKGVLLGTGVTAIIQSSSATSVMVVGFVNAGMIKMKQAIGIIMGAIIGTSVTGWVLCLSDISGGAGWVDLLSTEVLAAIIGVIGIMFRMICKNPTKKHIGDIMIGFCILMVGMQNMSAAVAPLRSEPAFLDLLTFGGEFPDGKVRKGYSKDYIHSFSAVLQQSFRFAVFPKQLISFNPMQYIKLKKQAEEVDLFSDDEVEDGTQPISHEDYERLIKYLEKKNPPAILPIQIAYYAGLRIGETCGLTWQDINLEDQCLTIKRSIRYDGAKHKNVIGTTKRKKVRIVDFGDTLTEILKAARREQLKSRMQYGELYHRNYYKEVHVKNRVYYEYYHLDGTQEVPADYKEISFVCLRPDGSLELPSTLGIACRSVSKKLEGFEDFHFHQLRHTYTSNLLSNGAAPKDVQELLGHSDVSTTMNIYAHSTRKAKRDSARLLDKVASNA